MISGNFTYNRTSNEWLSEFGELNFGRKEASSSKFTNTQKIVVCSFFKRGLTRVQYKIQSRERMLIFKFTVGICKCHLGFFEGWRLGTLRRAVLN